MLTETPEFLSKVREAGYDGLVGYDEGVKYIAVMSPGQLKDAYENTGAFSTSNDDIRFRQVYHGSPASFGHFDHAFTGTGEGAQAYGWGTYVTEVKGIARKYAAIGIKRGNHITYDGEPLSPVLDNEYYFDEVWRIWKRQILSSTDVDSLKRNISSVYMDGRTASAYSGRRKAFEQQKQELLSDIDAGRIRIEPPRHLYTVEIPENNGMNYLYCTGTGRYPRSSRERYSCNSARNVSSFRKPRRSSGAAGRMYGTVGKSSTAFWTICS